MDKVNPRHYNIDGIPVEEYYYRDDNNKMCLVIKDNEGCTELSKKLLKKVKNNFNKFVIASVDYHDESEIKERGYRHQYLLLEDEDGNQLHLSGCGSGYQGDGPRGTLEVLNSLGFNIDKRYVYTAKIFRLELSDHYSS